MGLFWPGAGENYPCADFMVPGRQSIIIFPMKKRMCGNADPKRLPERMTEAGNKDLEAEEGADPFVFGFEKCAPLTPEMVREADEDCPAYQNRCWLRGDDPEGEQEVVTAWAVITSPSRFL